MSDKIQRIVSVHGTTGHDDSFNIAPENTLNSSLVTRNDVEVDHESLLAKAHEQAYFDCHNGASYELCWENGLNDSDATPTASGKVEALGYLDHSEPRPFPFQKPYLPFPPILHLDTHLARAVDEKGKGRMVVTKQEAEPIIWESDQETPLEDSGEDNGGLTREEQDEQSRRDAEMSLLLLAQELIEQGVPQEEVASYVFQTQVFAMSSNRAPALASPFHPPKSSSRYSLDEKPDLDRIAQLTVDEIAKRSLPPAYGPNYSPEPSTSQAGSPILAIRRLSISSITSGVSTTSASSGAPSSSYTLEEEDELVARMQQFLDERYEANKMTILCELDKEAKKKQKLEQSSRSRHWDMWRQHFGLGLVGGVDENWTTGDHQHRNHSSFRSIPPNNVKFPQEGGHSCGHGHNDQGSAARIPRGPPSRKGPDQFPISHFATGDRGI